jgi:hypothetical protein
MGDIKSMYRPKKNFMLKIKHYYSVCSQYENLVKDFVNGKELLQLFKCTVKRHF